MSCSVFKGKVKNLPYAIKMTLNLEYPLVTNLANFSKLIFDYFDNTSWAGFYLTGLDNNLYLGPFQGDTATPFIEYGKGVCGTSLKDKEVKLVPNVHEFPGHIACSESSNSEIVVPIIKDNKVVGVIDLDSTLFDNYDVEDSKILVEVAEIISQLF